jgi:hypothetical protein
LAAEVGGAEGFQFGIDVVLNPDPEIDATGFVTGLGPDDQSLQQFTISITLFGNTGGQASLIEGDWQSGIADSSGTDGGTGSFGTLATVGGSSFYSALIDNIVQQTLFDDPFQQDVDATPDPGGSPGPGGHSGYVNNTFGIPIPNPGPIVTTSIGVKFDFAMTGGFDTAEITGGFKVKPVPEPTTALLIAIGLIGLARTGRRR